MIWKSFMPHTRGQEHTVDECDGREAWIRKVAAAEDDRAIVKIGQPEEAWQNPEYESADFDTALTRFRLAESHLQAEVDKNRRRREEEYAEKLRRLDELCDGEIPVASRFQLLQELGTDFLSDLEVPDQRRYIAVAKSVATRYAEDLWVEVEASGDSERFRKLVVVCKSGALGYQMDFDCSDPARWNELLAKSFAAPKLVLFRGKPLEPRTAYEARAMAYELIAGSDITGIKWLVALAFSNRGPSERSASYFAMLGEPLLNRLVEKMTELNRQYHLSVFLPQKQ